MGRSPLGPVLANIFVGYCKKKLTTYAYAVQTLRRWHFFRNYESAGSRSALQLQGAELCQPTLNEKPTRHCPLSILPCHDGTSLRGTRRRILGLGLQDGAAIFAHQHCHWLLSPSRSLSRSNFSPFSFSLFLSLLPLFSLSLSLSLSLPVLLASLLTLFFSLPHSLALSYFHPSFPSLSLSSVFFPFLPL